MAKKSKKSKPLNPLVVPEGAVGVEVAAEENGALEVRWFEPVSDDDESGCDIWWRVRQSADRRTVDVTTLGAEPSLTNALDTLKHVLQYQSAVNVNYCNK